MKRHQCDVTHNLFKSMNIQRFKSLIIWGMKKTEYGKCLNRESRRKHAEEILELLTDIYKNEKEFLIPFECAIRRVKFEETGKVVHETKDLSYHIR